MRFFSKKTKAGLAVLAAIACTVCLSSCCEISQTVTLKDGKYKVSYSLSVPNSFLELMEVVGQMQGDENPIAEITESFSAPQIMPQSATVISEVRASDFVVESECEFAADTTDSAEIVIRPIQEENAVVIPLMLTEEEVSDASSGMFMLQMYAAMISPDDPNYTNVMLGLAAINSCLDGIKYRVYVSKDICPAASRAYLPYFTEETDGRDVVLNDRGGVYEVLIPLSYLMDTSAATDNTLVYLVK